MRYSLRNLDGDRLTLRALTMVGVEWALKGFFLDNVSSRCGIPFHSIHSIPFHSRRGIHPDG